VILYWDASPGSIENYRFALGSQALSLDSASLALRALHENAAADHLVVGPGVSLESAMGLAEEIRVERPEVGVLLIRNRLDVATLSQALRVGVREVVAADDQSALVEALRRSRDLSARMAGVTSGGTSFGKVITVFSAKGGVGKTTLATNVGALLAKARRRTLLLDLDLAFGDVAISLHLAPTRTISEARAMTGHLDLEGIESLVTRHDPSGLDVLCAPQDPGDADRLPPTLVAEILRVARTSYDYIIVDTPPSFTEHVLSAVDVSDLHILIATLDIPAVKNLRVALDTLDALGSPKESRVIVLNRSDAKVGLNPDDVVSAIHSPISVQIPGSIAVPAAVNRGVAIALEEPRHAVSLALADLADREIRGRFGEDLTTSPARRRGLFRSRT
jgi:pilus assembly protein CpaE